MTEVGEVRTQGILVDPKAEGRYAFIVEQGKSQFADSALVDPNRKITEGDLALITAFHKMVSPLNPDNPYGNAVAPQNPLDLPQISDTSTYGNWEAPGGPLEHIELATLAAKFLVEKLAIPGIDPLHAAAAAALHDEGRGITHLFYTNETIGKRMLQQIGIRADLTQVMPSEDVMLIPLDEDMDAAIERLSPETVIIRIADEFGKRATGTNRLYQPEDYDTWDRQRWADGYTNRPQSGRPSDAWWRTQRQLHVDNVPRYFQALDTWTQKHAGISLKELTGQLQDTLGPSLRPLPNS